MKAIGNKIYAVCPDCAKLVCVNKKLFGSAHVCSTPEERRQYASQIAAMARQMEEKLKALC